MQGTNCQTKLNNELWRLNNLYYIKDKAGKKVLFRMNWAQKMFYESMWYLNIILKARQLGMTTFIQIFMLDRCLFNKNTSAGVIAQDKDNAESFFDDKIKFAYDNLPKDLKRMVSASTDNSRELAFSNGSKIRVGTSMRSGTLQYLHISEFGKLCAENAKKAKEVITGSLNTVAPGQFIFIESTAEGPSGKFYEMCQTAMALYDAVLKGTAELTKMDYKFCFFPWHKHPDYVLRGVNVHISDEMREYFAQLEAEEGITLTTAQRAWYVKKAEEQGDEMKQEYPATPQEAFLKLLKGVIFAEQIRKARKEHRICSLPIERGVPVNTFWDLGRNDFTAIWFHQRVNAWDNFIFYYEYRLMDLTYYADCLRDFKDEYGWFYGDHYLPHDVEVTELSERHNESRKEILESAGVKPIIPVPRIRVKNTAIELARKVFNRCRFDEKRCAKGIERLSTYRWQWDDRNQTFVKNPQKGDANHGADAFQQFGQGYKGPRGSIRDQIERIDGTGARAYLRNQRTRNPLTNPTTDHIL
jgi:hypothetical protein